MGNPFLIIRERRHKFELYWVARTFASPNTFRFLRGVSAERVRKFMREAVGDAKALSRASSQPKYDLALARLIKKLQRIGPRYFGHASKLINPYIKELVSRPGILGPAEAKRIQRWAHVPIDRVILQRLREHFPEHPAIQAIPQGLSLKKLSVGQYQDLQAMLRTAAKQAVMHPIDYDLWWSRPTSKQRETGVDA